VAWARLPNGPDEVSTSPTFNSVGLALVEVTDGIASHDKGRSARALEKRKTCTPAVKLGRAAQVFQVL
jgi:hypothetical protein